MSTEATSQDSDRDRKRAINRAYYHRNKSVGQFFEAELTLIALTQKPTEAHKNSKEANRTRCRTDSEAS